MFLLFFSLYILFSLFIVKTKKHKNVSIMLGSITFFSLYRKTTKHTFLKPQNNNSKYLISINKKIIHLNTEAKYEDFQLFFVTCDD